MWETGHILSYVGSVLPDHHGTKGATHAPHVINTTTEAPAANTGLSTGDNFTEMYTIIVIILSTLLPLICVILSAIFVRKLWVKFYDQPPSATAVEREDTAQTSIKSSREVGSSRKSSRAGSRVSKSDPNSRDQLISQDDSTNASLEEPIIVVGQDDAVPSTSHGGQETQISVEIEDDGGFGSGRTKFRNQSLKVDMEGSPHRINHHRSYSDLGKNRRKSEQDPVMQLQAKESAGKQKSSNFLAAPGAGTKIRKSHSMRYRTDSPAVGVGLGARPRVAQDDCIGDLKRITFEPDVMVTSPRLQQRRSPHHFYQQQHHPQVHQQPHSNHQQPPHAGHQQPTNLNYQQSQSTQQQPIHSGQQQPHLSHQQSHPVHQQSLSSQQQHHLSHQQSHPSHQQLHSSQKQSHMSHQLQRHYSLRQREPEPIIVPEPFLNMPENIEEVAIAPPEVMMEEEEEEATAGNFGLSTSDLSLEENGPSNPSYQYGNQPPNKYPPLNKALYYGGFYGYPVTSMSYPSTDPRSRRLHVSSHQPSGTSPTGEEETLEDTGRKKSLPNDLDIPPPEIQPMPVLSPRGLLSKQYSLPSAARNPRLLRGSSQRHHASLRHDPAPQRLLDAPTLARRASARERTSSAALPARRTISGGSSGSRHLGRTSGSFNLGRISPRSPIPPSSGGAVSPRGHLTVVAVSRTGSSPTPRALPDDQLQHI